MSPHTEKIKNAFELLWYDLRNWFIYDLLGRPEPPEFKPCTPIPCGEQVTCGSERPEELAGNLTATPINRPAVFPETTDAPLTELVQIIETRREVGSDPGFVNAWDRAEVAARLDALHAENQRLRTEKYRLEGILAIKPNQLENERDALRDAVRAMKAEERAHSFNVDGPTSYIVDTETIDAALSEAGERRE